MSVPSNTSGPETPKKEPKVIVLSMKDGKTFRYDFTTNVLTNVQGAAATALTKQPSSPSILSSSSSTTTLQSPTPPSTPTAANNSGPKFQNVVVQPVKKQQSIQQQQSGGNNNNILIRAQSPAGSSSKKIIQSPQSPIIDIVQPPTFRKISTDIVLKAQSPQVGNAVLLNPNVKNTTTFVALPQAVSKKFIIASQSQNIGSGQPTKIIQITPNPTQITRKIVQQVARPILPKPEAPKLVQSQQIIISQQRPVAIATNQQIKPNVITIPVNAAVTQTYSKANLQQQKFQSSQPPALSPIRSNPVYCVQSAQQQQPSHAKMDNMKILMEIEEMGSSEETEEDYEECEVKERDEDDDEDDEQHSQSSSVIVVVNKEAIHDAEKNNSTAINDDDDDEHYLNVKRIIEGDGGLPGLSEKKLSQSNNNISCDNEVNLSAKNDDESAVKKSDLTTKAVESAHNSNTLLLCDEQIASVSPEESPESSADKLKDIATPTHTNESSSVIIKTVNDVKKNLKLDLIASAHDSNSVTNRKKINMDDNESITSDEQSNQSSPVDRKGESKLDSLEIQTNAETGGNAGAKKLKRSRKPKNPTIITSLGLPYKPPQPSNRRKKVEKKVELELDFHDPIYKILWDDGVGGLNNCNKLFGFNEFGLVEVLNSKDAPRSNAEVLSEESVSFKCLRKINDPQDQFTCEVCSKLGTIRDFFSPECCSEACFAITKRRPAEMFNASNSTKDDDDSGFNTPVDAKKVIHDGELISIQQLYQRIYDDNSPADGSNYPKKKKRVVGAVPDHHFSWNSYLTAKSVPVPVSSFSTNIGLLKQTNQFKVGMKLEAIDPKNPHMFCVCTVEEKLGYRMKLHFDGYPSSYDFWVNIDSVNIFPAGFCESTGRKLCVPPRWNSRKFNWDEYFEETTTVGALSNMFPRLSSASNKSIDNPLKPEMKLEVKNGDNWYAATIIDNLDERVLVRLDGKYEKLGCQWYDIYSPHLKPCNGHKELDNPSLFQPPTGSLATFDWEEYLNETNEVAAPEDFLRNSRREPRVFECGMKLEVVDPACRQLIRPATVLCHEDYKIQVIFDGFDTSYAFWLDDDSEDMFAINYCNETDHPIEHPAGWNKNSESTGLCSIAGCRGVGNGIYPDRYFHDNPKECPYKIENWKRIISNKIGNSRLDYKPNLKRGRGSAAAPNTSARRHDSNEKSRAILVHSKKAKVEKLPKSPAISSHDDTSNDVPSVVKVPLKRGRKRKIPIVEPVVQEPVIEEAVQMATENDDHELKKIRLMAPFLEDYGPQINYSFNLWTSNSKILDKARITDQDITKNPMHWNLEEVCTFMIKFCDEETTAKFYAQKIDGEALLCLCQKDLVDLMNIKLGPAIKIYNRILLLRQEVMTKFAKF